MHRAAVVQRQGGQWKAAVLAAATAAGGIPGVAAWAAPRDSSAHSVPVVPAAAASSPPAAGSVPQGSPAPAASDQSGGAVQLKVRRMPDALELVIEGTGAGPQLQQSSSGSGWEGQLITAQATGLRMGPQRLSLPEVGLQTITLDGSGRTYRVSVTPMPGYPVGRPVVSADGQNLILSFPGLAQANLQTNRLDLNTPGRVPQPAYAPPLQPRAVAPPLGDMAVGSMTLRNPSFVNVNGPRVTLTLNNAPAKDALMSLARIGGYGFVLVDDMNKPGSAGSPQAAASSARNVSVAFNNESYPTAFNTVLLAAGIQGKLEGNIIFAGANVLGKGFGPRLSKVYRLNQVSANSAADYLANLGATVTKTNTITTAVTQGASQNESISGGSTSATTTSSSQTTVEAYGAATGPLLGLQATTDSRLGTITLIGDSSVVSVAEQYLRQLDLRQRQVALSVKILDITLENDTLIDNSFAYRWGNNFIVNANGQLISAFGNLLPPRSLPQFNEMAGDAESTKPNTTVTSDGSSVLQIDPVFPTPANPGRAYAEDNFYQFITAKIQSSSTKVLASPTLILSENSQPLEGGGRVLPSIASSNSGAGGGGAAGGSGFSNATIGRPQANESFVTVGTQVINTYAVTQGQNGGPPACQPGFDIAGLTFGAKISKIDDNGFVTFAMSPEVSAITGATRVENCGPVSILSKRRLDTGLLRVRDGQTLILTGVISDSDAQAVSKWPILGDIPFIGQFFRSTLGGRKKNELVIMVTPKIINDDQGGSYGYGYRPDTPQAREFMGAR